MSMFTIGEAATIVGRSVRTLRRYEAAGLITPQRIGTYAHRMYTPEDLEILKALVHEHSQRRIMGYTYREAARRG